MLGGGPQEAPRPAENQVLLGVKLLLMLEFAAQVASGTGQHACIIKEKEKGKIRQLHPTSFLGVNNVLPTEFSFFSVPYFSRPSYYNCRPKIKAGVFSAFLCLLFDMN